MLSLERWENSTPTRMESAVNVLLRYKLLDILSGVLDVPTHPDRHATPQVSIPNLPTRVHQVSKFQLKQQLCPDNFADSDISFGLDILHRQFPQDFDKGLVVFKQRKPNHILVGPIVPVIVL
jgi:hypothetical protein